MLEIKWLVMKVLWFSRVSEFPRFPQKPFHALRRRSRRMPLFTAKFRSRKELAGMASGHVRWLGGNKPSLPIARQKRMELDSLCSSSESLSFYVWQLVK